MQKFKVEIESICTHSHRSPEEFGDWSESYDNYFKEIIMDDSIEYPDVSSTLIFSPLDEVWVVWVEYSYGDSFGRGDCAGTDVVGVFKDADSAFQLKNAIQNQDTSKPDWNTRYQLKLETSDGQKFDLYTGSWNDYFGGLDEVHVERTLLIQHSK